MSDQLTYLVPPSFTFRPYTGPIKLGSIITDPTRPHRYITELKHDELADRYPLIEVVPESKHEVTRSSHNNVSAAVWARFWEVASTEASREQKTQRTKSYTMEALQTEYFVGDPSSAEINRRIEHPRIKAILYQSQHWHGIGCGQPVYMVNGIKIAKELAIVYEDTADVTTAVSAEATAPTPAGDVSAGTRLSHGKGVADRDEAHLIGDVVFAYQLLVIQYGNTGRTKLKVDEFRPKAGFQSADWLPMDDTGDRDGKVLMEADIRQASVSDLVREGNGIGVLDVSIDGVGTRLSILSFPLKR
jgi:hypothetical protein